MPAEPKLAITRSPSVTGVAEQYGFLLWVGSLAEYGVAFSHSSLPLLRSKHMSARFVPLESTGCVMNTRSPQTMGDEFPGPGSATRQRTFSFAPHFNGSSCSLVKP